MKKKIIRILLLQDLRSLDKSMREWHAYKGLETTVKNMLTGLRAVGELQNSAIRDRHWCVLYVQLFTHIEIVLLQTEYGFTQIINTQICFNGSE